MECQDHTTDVIFLLWYCNAQESLKGHGLVFALQCYVPGLRCSDCIFQVILKTLQQTVFGNEVIHANSGECLHNPMKLCKSGRQKFWSSGCR